MKLKRSLNLLVICSVASILAACNLAPIKPTATHGAANNFPTTAKLMLELTDKCWNKPVRGWAQSDAIYGKAKRVENGLIIIIGRDNTDIPFMPFARIIVNNTSSGEASVVVEEGDVAYGLRYDVNRSVKEWLEGRRTCGDLKSYELPVKG